MGLRPRIAITPASFRISRAGVNVLSPPSTTPEHLVMNSDWTSVERRHEIALVKNRTLESPVTINLITPLPEPPLVVMLTRNVGTRTLRDTQTHESTYWESLFPFSGYLKRTVQEDTHLVDWTSTSQIRLLQKHRNRANEPAPSQSSFVDVTKYDFIVLVFKQGA